jgi:hypothetical protein
VDIRVGFHATKLGILFAELNRLDAELLENLRDIRSRFGDKLVGEKIAVAIDDGERGLFGAGGGFHGCGWAMAGKLI